MGPAAEVRGQRSLPPRTEPDAVRRCFVDTGGGCGVEQPGLVGWAVFFFLLNTVYFVFVEEPGLEQRFGEPYLRYKAAVP